MKSRIYVRVSTDEQAKGMSVDAQVSRIKQWAETKGRTVDKIYKDEGHTASIKEDDIKFVLTQDSLTASFQLHKRPALQQMFSDAKKKEFDELIIFKWDRFSRNTAFQFLAYIALKKLGVNVVPSDDDNSPFIRDIKGAVNMEESRKIGERVKNTMRLKFEQGIYPSSKPPYGYILKKQKGIFPDKKKAIVIKELFRMIMVGHTYKGVCDKFSIKPQSYYNIIKNKVYYGIIEFEGVEKVGIHQPLISKELFDKVNSK